MLLFDRYTTKRILQMKKIALILFFIMFHTLYADEIYMCFPDIITGPNGKVRDVSKDKPGKMVIKTTWYGKPTYMIAYKPDGKTVGQMFESTQTKVEWVQSTKLTFKHQDNRRTFSMSLEKGETPILEITETRNNISVKGILKCFKQ